MNKIKIIAWREYRLALTSWPFWLVAVGLPLFMILICLITFFIGINPIRSGADTRPEKAAPILGILDQVGLLDWELQNQVKAEKPEPPEKLDDLMGSINLPEPLKKRISEALASVPDPARAIDYKVFQNEAEALTAIREKKIRGALIFSADFLESNQARLIIPDKKTRIPLSLVERDLREIRLQNILGPDQTNQILRPLAGLTRQYLEIPTEEKSPGLKQKLTPYILPIVFLFIFILVIATSTDRLLRGLVEEKTNRVIEILLSSTTSDQLMAGKVIGLGLVGLTQLSIWMFLGLLPASWILLFIDFHLGTLLVFPIFFLLGYFQMGSLVLGLGSLGKNLQEANQWIAILMILSMLPMMMVPFLVENPTGQVAQILTWVPITSPLVVVLRYGADAISFWELLGAGLVLCVANLVTVKISARVFRIGILMTGKTATPRELWRALKDA